MLDDDGSLDVSLITRIGYGYLKLKPWELWDLSTREFVDMYEAHIYTVNEDYDVEMQRTSWFTALLMNASGNMKTRVKPDKLYKPIEKQKELSEEKQKEYIATQREELERKFNIKT